MTPRQLAIKNGLKRYYTGIACKRGHLSERKVNNCECVECARVPTLERSLRYYYNNREAKKKYAKEYYELNKHLQKGHRKAWRENNKEKTNAYFREKYHNDLNHKLGVQARRMLNRCCEACGIRKSANTWKSLGYTKIEFKEYIEKKFLEGMSWENHGLWHIDHIKPILAFVKDGIADISLINALANLQPLWAEENLAKSSKYENTESLPIFGAAQAV